MEEIQEVVEDKRPILLEDLGYSYPRETSKQKRKYGWYKCQYCGKEFKGLTDNINSGKNKSCGCLLGEKHGLSYHNFYDMWKGMEQRCNNPKASAYKNYGGRGIKVCEEWLDIKNFLQWVDSTHPNMEGLSLDRIDNDKGYSPDNCRWADAFTQNTNQRISSKNTSGYVGVSFDKSRGKWIAQLRNRGVYIHLGRFDNIEDAIHFRDNYIIENNLQNRLNIPHTKKEENE